MDIDLDAVLEVVAQQAKAVAMLQGQLVALQKFSQQQTKDLLEANLKLESKSTKKVKKSVTPSAVK